MRAKSEYANCGQIAEGVAGGRFVGMQFVDKSLTSSVRMWWAVGLDKVKLDAAMFREGRYRIRLVMFSR